MSQTQGELMIETLFKPNDMQVAVRLQSFYEMLYNMEADQEVFQNQEFANLIASIRESYEQTFIEILYLG